MKAQIFTAATFLAVAVIFASAPMHLSRELPSNVVKVGRYSPPKPDKEPGVVMTAWTELLNFTRRHVWRVDENGVKLSYKGTIWERDGKTRIPKGGLNPKQAPVWTEISTY